MAPMRKRRLALGIAAGTACFALGALSTRLLVQAPRPEGAPAGGADDLDGGPSFVIDPARIQLLPDASLRLTLPPGFDAG
jgi:hypothetical protein